VAAKSDGGGGGVIGGNAGKRTDGAENMINNFKRHL